MFVGFFAFVFRKMYSFFENFNQKNHKTFYFYFIGFIKNHETF